MAKLDLGGREITYDAKKKYLTVGVMGSCEGNVIGSYELTPDRLEFIAKRIRKGKGEFGEFDNVAAYLMWEVDKIQLLFRKGRIGLNLYRKDLDLVLEENDKKAYLNAVSLNKRILSAIKGIIKDEELEGMGFLEHHIGDKIKEIKNYPIVS